MGKIKNFVIYSNQRGGFLHADGSWNPELLDGNVKEFEELSLAVSHRNALWNEFPNCIFSILEWQ